MKIAIPTTEGKTVCASFGRAPFFLFYNDENQKSELIQNPASQASGGAGTKAAQFVLDNGADTVITVKCGENAGAVLNAAKIMIYNSASYNIEENIQLLKEKKLSLLEEFHKGFHGAQ